jgi:hypothetical protein
MASSWARRRRTSSPRAQRPPVQTLALAQHLAGLFQQGRTGGGQARLAAAAALEQQHTEIGFQHGDGAAHGRLRAVDPPRHRGKRLTFGHADKQTDLLQVPLHKPSPLQIGNHFIPSARPLE